MNCSNTLSGTCFPPIHRFRRLSLLVGLIVGLNIASTGNAQVTVGAGVATQGTANDSSSGQVYIYSETFGAGAVGHTLDTWSFRSGGQSGATREVTPLLLEFSSGNNYTIRAIGTTVSSSPSTLYTQSFGAIHGSVDIDTTNFYFGWKDGGLETSNAGVISWAGSHSATAGSFSGSGGIALTSGVIDTNVSLGTALGVRGYRFSATTLSAVPEPSAFALIMGGGILALTATRRRRRC